MGEQPARNDDWNASRCMNEATDQEHFKSMDYWCHGMEGSVNLGYWVNCYRGGKISTPNMGFLGIHVVTGATVLWLYSITTIWPNTRLKYAWPFFIATLALGIHTTPATMIVEPFPKVVLFSFTSIMCAILSIM